LTTRANGGCNVPHFTTKEDKEEHEEDKEDFALTRSPLCGAHLIGTLSPRGQSPIKLKYSSTAAIRLSQVISQCF